MGLMECPAGHGRLITTPHPVTLEGQTNIAAELVPGETLAAFLRRTVPDWTGDAWEVRINGVVVPVEVMDRVRPKDRTVIEVRGVAKKQALYIVAMIALTYFTFGAGAVAGFSIGTSTALGTMAAQAFVFAAGSILINKVLGPKPASASQRDQNPVHSLGASRNQMRQYQPLPLVFGRVKFAPDVISAPYSYFEGDDQYVAMVLTPGINVHRVEELYLGDALLSAFQGVRVYYSGFSGMPEQPIPLFGDADTVQGGELNKNQTWVQRATPARTVRIQINLEYYLGDQDSKQRPYPNRETVDVQYRRVGTSTWATLLSRTFVNSSYDQKRATLSRDVAEGQYDVRVRIWGTAMDGGGSNGRAQFQWSTMVAVQADTATYAGIPRIAVIMKASGQLQSAPDEIRCVAISKPVPVWRNGAWVSEETSNPGANILAYARGITDQNGDRIGGIGLTDDMADIASLQAFMPHCAANGFEYNFVIKDARNHDEMLSALAAAGFGQVTWASGRLSVVWASDEQPLAGVVNMATIKKGEFQVDYTLANPADGIEYSYYDAEDWSTKTIRVPAPGVTTMLNPATLTGEGVTSEAHAAMLARWHLAQSLYQYKDISFATDIEHLSYQRLSLLSLSHDLTQWGYSGRLVGASIVGGVVSLALDEPVPAPPPGGAYIGLRIPGERTYRVFPVQPFAGTSSTLTLAGAWPADAPLPGNSDGNPAHDTIWCYDFKATPGYRVRVVAIEPEGDLKGARVAVVPESPEYWHYVRTGQYIPAPNESLLQTRPIASNLVISERQVPQGDTVFTELVATYDITGPVGDVVVQMSNENGELEEVARTTTRTAVWRIPRAGTFQIVVRPFSPDGQPGIAVATIYSTIGADAPPVLVDLFDVQERSGGVRLYTWGWLTGTTQSADFAGVEIRYMAGNVPAPDWNAMTPVGTDGYYTAPFEAVIPESGPWTFAARSRNTSGTLSTGMRVIARNLGENLGEQIGGIGDSIDYITQQQIAQQGLIDQAASDAAQAQAAAAEALVLIGDPYSPDVTYPTGAAVYFNGRMYRALQTTLGIEPTDATYWADIGTVTEAQGSTTQAISQLRTDVDEQGDEFAAAIIQVRSGLVGGGNLVTNPEFLGSKGWFVSENSTGHGILVEPNLGAVPGDPNVYAPLSQPSLMMFTSGAPAAGTFVQAASDTLIPVELGDRLIASAWVNAFRCNVQVVLFYYDARKAFIGRETALMGPASIDAANFNNVPRPSLLLSIQSAAVAYVRIGFDQVSTGLLNAYAWITRPMVEKVGPGKTTPSPYADGAAGLSSATLALQVAQDAQITLTTNVNNHVTGMVSKNDGQRGVVSFLADVFEIIASGSIGVNFGRTGRGGYCMRFYASAIQLVMGINFGQTNNLCFWYGPNVGEANANKSNGTIWFDNTGSAYFRGAIIAGSIRNGGYSSSTNASVTYSTGPFGTIGTPIQVNASYAFSQTQIAAAASSNIAAGGGSTAATIQLWRSIGGAAMQLISAQNLTGSLGIRNETDGPSSATYSIAGSIAFMDNDGGTATRNYEIRMINRTQQSIVVSGGGITAIDTSQSTGVTTAEN